MASFQRIAPQALRSCSSKAEGAYLWDAEGNRYIDYHAAFAPHFLGHNDPYVTEAVRRVLDDGASLYGSGTTVLEGRLAELVCKHVPAIEAVQFLNTGSEASYQAIRLARAITGRDHIIVMQGGYNGWHNDVSCNLMTPLEQLGPRVSPGEYPYKSDQRWGSGGPSATRSSDQLQRSRLRSSMSAKSTQWRALITEPILQNIGIVKPERRIS